MVVFFCLFSRYMALHFCIGSSTSTQWQRTTFSVCRLWLNPWRRLTRDLEVTRLHPVLLRAHAHSLAAEASVLHSRLFDSSITSAKDKDVFICVVC